MFDSLQDRLSSILDKLKGRGVLTESDVDEAMRQIRIALLEADVALPVVKDFIAKVKTRAVGEEVIKSVSASDMVTKIVHDTLLETLGEKNEDLNLNVPSPAVVLMLGLQASGKTTTTGKLAKFLQTKRNKKVLAASLDIYRPAAQQQLAQLGETAGFDTLPIVDGQKPAEITKRALKEAKIGGYDVLLLDTAGRIHIDEDMMSEAALVKQIASPVETLLVVDALSGQDALNVAKEFNDKIGITGTIFTRIDGDARGGAALSVRFITGSPLKFLATGEKLDALEPFYPDRLAGRILGMGDVVSLVETAMEKIDSEEAEKSAKRLMKGSFDLEDMLSQIRQIKNIGDIKGFMKLIPGISKLAKQIDEAKLEDGIVEKQEAIILSMTVKERHHPEIIKASRRKRIAAGSGTTVQDVNKLLKRFEQMQLAMKKMKKFGGLEALMGAQPSQDDVEKLMSGFKPPAGSSLPFGLGKFPFGKR